MSVRVALRYRDALTSFPEASNKCVTKDMPGMLETSVCDALPCLKQILILVSMWELSSRDGTHLIGVSCKWLATQAGKKKTILWLLIDE